MFQEMNDVAKETITVLEHFDRELIKKIPKKFLDYLYELSSTSNYDIYIDLEKELTNQNISEESKDLIALIYYSYIADEQEKKRIVKLWNENEQIYAKELEEKYNPDNMFRNKTRNISMEETNLTVKIKESSLLDKIISVLSRVFKMK